MVSKIKIICIGKIKENNIKIFCNEIEKRIKSFCNFNIIELKDKGINMDTENIIQKIKEEKIQNVFIMDEKGKDLNSLEFSELIKNTENEICFIIGGSDGLLKKIKEEYRIICLSKMTFTHEMARMFLTEQIYRSMMILNKRAYHK